MGETGGQLFSLIVASLATLFALLAWVLRGGEAVAVRALAVAGILCVVAVAAHVRRE